MEEDLISQLWVRAQRQGGGKTEGLGWVCVCVCVQGGGLLGDTWRLLREKKDKRKDNPVSSVRTPWEEKAAGLKELGPIAAL